MTANLNRRKPTMSSVQALRGIFVQRIGGKTVLILDPNGCDAISRAAWLGLTNEMRRQRERPVLAHPEEAT